MKICALSSSTCDKGDRFLCNSFWRLLFPETEHARSCKFPCSIKSWFLQFGPINRHRCITVPPSFCVFCALFLYIAEWLTGSLFFKAETISGDSSSNFTCRENFWKDGTKLQVKCTNTYCNKRCTKKCTVVMIYFV